MIKNKYGLLETALNELIKKLCLKFPLIENLCLKITKPTIIKNAKVSLSKSFVNQ
jgi:dihydroneopterin aldolase